MKKEMRLVGGFVFLLFVFALMFIGFIGLTSASARFEQQNLGSFPPGTNFSVNVTWVQDDYVFIWDNRTNLINQSGLSNCAGGFSSQTAGYMTTYAGDACPFACSSSIVACTKKIPRFFNYTPLEGYHNLRIRNYNIGSGCELSFNFYINNVLNDSYTYASTGAYCEVDTPGLSIGHPYKNYTFRICDPVCPSPEIVTCGVQITPSNGCRTCSGNGTNCSVGLICQSNICVQSTTINLPHWASFKNKTIILTTADIGDNILMVVPGVGLGDINYSVYDKNNFLWFDKKIASLSATEGVGIFTPNQSGTYYFKAKIGNIENQSGDIVVSGTANFHPVANIVSPLSDKYKVNSIISFNQSSYDEDDMLRITWNFGDGINSSFDNYSLAITPFLANLDRSYSSSGEKIVKLKAQEMTRGQYDEEIKKIYVFKEGVNVVPIISSPIDSSENDNEEIIRFTGINSYVVNCTSASMSVVDFTVDSLNCSYIHSPGQMTFSGYNLTVSWILQGQTGVSGNWNETNLNFVKFYSNPGLYNAKLNITYNSGNIVESQLTQVNFYTEGGWNCSFGASTASWVKIGSSPLISINALNNCTAFLATYGSSCCPTDNICENNNCRSTTASLCSHLTTEPLCDAASSSIILNSFRLIFQPQEIQETCGKITASSTGVNCYSKTICSCVWQEGNCSAGLNFDEICENDRPVDQGICSWNITSQNNCGKQANNIIVSGIAKWVNLTATATRDADCVNLSTRILACPGSGEELGFFGFVQMIIGLIAVALIYAVVLVRRKN